MTERADEPRSHRDVAVELFNATWDLIDRADRTDADEIDMALAAMTSRWHWGQVGGPEETATGDWQVAHVLSLIGEGSLAVRFARRNLDTAVAEGWTGWRLASAHEGMARASAAAGDAPGRAAHVAAANAALEAEPDTDEREAIAQQIATVPEL